MTRKAGLGRRSRGGSTSWRSGEPTRSLLDIFTTLLPAGMRWVWREALPALSVIGDYALWTYSDIVDDKPAHHPVTVGGLFLAMVVAAVTAVAVRNVGALLDIVLLLQRLDNKRSSCRTSRSSPTAW